MCQIPIKMLKLHAIPNSSLLNLTMYSSKGCRETKSKMNYMCATNTVIISSNFQWKISFQVTGFCFAGE